MVTLYCSFYTLLDLICWYFLRILCLGSLVILIDSLISLSLSSFGFKIVLTSENELEVFLPFSLSGRDYIRLVLNFSLVIFFDLKSTLLAINRVITPYFLKKIMFIYLFPYFLLSTCLCHYIRREIVLVKAMYIWSMFIFPVC